MASNVTIRVDVVFDQPITVWEALTRTGDVVDAQCVLCKRGIDKICQR